MATVNENVQRIKTAKASIKASIEAKGVTVPADALIDTYAAKIDEIEAGGYANPSDLKMFSTIGYDKIYGYADMANSETPEEYTARLKNDIAYSKTKYDAWDPSFASTSQRYSNDENLVYAPKIDTGNVTDMSSMFSGCTKLAVVPLLNTSRVTDMSSMFNIDAIFSGELKTVPLFDTSKVTNMSSMFRGCSSLISVPKLDTSSVTSMKYMFKGCTSLQEISAFDASNVTDMSEMFSSCSSIKEIPNFTTKESILYNIGSMFNGCSSLVTIPAFRVERVKFANKLFNGCTSLENLGGLIGMKMSLDLQQSTKLTHQSLLNVIDNLGQADPGYSAGQPVLTIGSENLAKLSQEEIAVGTAKGWQIVA